MNEKEQFLEEFNSGLHRIGRITMISVICILVAIVEFLIYTPMLGTGEVT